MSVIPLTADRAYGPIDGTPSVSAPLPVDAPAAPAGGPPDTARPATSKFSVGGVIDDPTFWLVAALALAILLARFHATGALI